MGFHRCWGPLGISVGDDYNLERFLWQSRVNSGVIRSHSRGRKVSITSQNGMSDVEGDEGWIGKRCNTPWL